MGFFQDRRRFNLTNSGSWRNNGKLSYTFTGNGISPESNIIGLKRIYRDHDGLTDLLIRGKVREAFDFYEKTLGVDFFESTRYSADFRIADEQTKCSRTCRPYKTGKAFNDSTTNIRRGPNHIKYNYLQLGKDRIDDPGNLDQWRTILHEIAHGLGLGHLGNYNNEVEKDQIIARNDSRSMSIMSYITPKPINWRFFRKENLLKNRTYQMTHELRNFTDFR